jgi:hypothetical protein
MTWNRITTTLRTMSTAVATTGIALALSATPAHAQRPNPQFEPSTLGMSTVVTTPAEAGMQLGPVAVGTGGGVLIGAGLALVVLRSRRRAAPDAAAA